MQKIRRKELLILSLVLLASWAFMISNRLTEVPPLWFDEGWTLARARTWVETGQYARLLDGEPISAVGMGWNLPITVPIAASFSTLGIGVWQGRLPITIFAVASLLASWVLTRRIYGSSAAWWGLFVLLVLPMEGGLNTLFIGKQALGEIPMIFYLIMGYLFATSFFSGKSYSGLLAGIFWGLALDTKSQLFPFLFAAIVLPTIISFLRKQRKLTNRFLVLALFSILSWGIIRLITGYFEAGLPLYGSPMRDLYSVTAFVLNLQVRLKALNYLVTFGWAVALGILYEAWYQKKAWLNDYSEEKTNLADSYVRMSLFVLMFCWGLWFVLLSIGWGRYFFPVYYLAAAPLGALLSNLFRPRQRNELRIVWVLRLTFGAIIVIYGMVFNFTSYQLDAQKGNADALEVANWINQNTPTTARIETYDSELLFLLDRSVHYPPDQIQVELNKRTFLKENVTINYPSDILNVDYIVIGPYGRMWQLYDDFLLVAGYQKIKTFSGYEIYQNIDSE